MLKASGTRAAPFLGQRRQQMPAGIQPPPRPQGHFTLPSYLRAFALTFPLQGNSSFLSLSYTCLTLTHPSYLSFNHKETFLHIHRHSRSSQCSLLSFLIISCTSTILSPRGNTQHSQAEQKGVEKRARLKDEQGEGKDKGPCSAPDKKQRDTINSPGPSREETVQNLGWVESCGLQ